MVLSAREPVVSHAHGRMGGSPSPPLDPVAVSEELVPLPNLKQAGCASIDFDGQLDRKLMYYEDARAGCGGQTWPAGLVLAKHMLRYHRREIQDATVNTAKGSLLLTDQEEMLGLMQHNIRLNDVESRATALVLNWGEALPEEVVRRRPSVILAAECVYFEPAFLLLMQTLRQLLALNSGAVVYFCFKKRRRADLQFIKKAKKAFVVEEIADEDRPVFQRQQLFLFSLRSKAADV